MLALALPEVSFEQIADFSVCESNLMLLQLYAISFGPKIEAFATCAHCGTYLEMQFGVTELIERQRAAISSVAEEWSENGQLYRLRPVTNGDLLSALDAATSVEAEEAILQRCTTVLPQASDSLPPPNGSDSTPLTDRFERVNQGNEISCIVACPGCSGRFERTLNLAQFLFRLVDRGAKRLLREIHELAWAYGWSEEAILRMSNARRGAYLEMLHA